MQDAQDVMGMLVKVQNEQGEMEPDDPQVLARDIAHSVHTILCLPKT